MLTCAPAIQTPCSVKSYPRAGGRRAGGTRRARVPSAAEAAAPWHVRRAEDLATPPLRRDNDAMSRPTPDDDLLDLPALLADAAVEATTLQQPAPFLDWLRANLCSTRRRALSSFTTRSCSARSRGRSVAHCDAMPLPRRGFLTEPIPESGRNDPCPCGSGRKFKHCCARAPSLGPFTTPLVWPYVLRALSGPTREEALRSSHLPREAVLQYASDEIEAEIRRSRGAARTPARRTRSARGQPGRRRA